ncbi:MAG: nitroreductase family protein [archaeon]
MQLDKAIKTRHSVRKFTNQKPDWRDIIECIDTCRFAPMAGNNFTLKFILVDDPEKIQKFGDCCQQNFVSTAPYVVVVCTVPNRAINCFGENAEKYCRQQAGAAIQNFLLKITDKDLASCWVGYFAEDQIKETLKIPNNVQIEAILPVGYEYKKTKLKSKINLDTILFFQEYNNQKMKNPKKINV